MLLSRGRQQGQAIVIAALCMVAMVGGLAMVIDIGMFMVAQAQLQSAAEAGALAGVWHEGACPTLSVGCRGAPASATFATQVAEANADTVKQLCNGTVTIHADDQHLNVPLVNVVTVTVECDAGYSFGRIFNLTTKHITAKASAAIGSRTTNGDIGDFPSSCGASDPPCVLGRLVR